MTGSSEISITAMRATAIHGAIRAARRLRGRFADRGRPDRTRSSRASSGSPSGGSVDGTGGHSEQGSSYRPFESSFKTGR